MLNDKRILKFIVSKWLRVNAREQRDSMSKQESWDLFDVYSKVLEFHSPEYRTRIHSPKSDKFKIRIKEPKLRGTKVMVLPSVSLCLEVGWCGARILTDVKDYLTGSISYDYLMELAKWINKDRTNHLIGRDLKEAIIPIHPHINASGDPCLGDFGQPWSVCLQQGNLGMLHNIAKGFVDNWTRDDAYWDINRKYSDWSLSKAIPFKKMVILQTVLQKWASELDLTSNIVSMRSFSYFWLSDEASKLRSLGWTPEVIYLNWSLTKLLKSRFSDLPDKNLNGIKNQINADSAMIVNMHSTITNKIDSNGIHVSGLMDGALVQDFQEERAYNDLVHTNISIGGEWMWTKSGLEEIKDVIRNIRLQTAQDTDDALAVIKTKAKACKVGEDPISENTASLETCCYALGRQWYLTRSRTQDTNGQDTLWIRFYQRMNRHYESTANSLGGVMRISEFISDEHHKAMFDFTELEKLSKKFAVDYDNDVAQSRANGGFDSHTANFGKLLLGILDTANKVKLIQHLAENQIVWRERAEVAILKHTIFTDVYESVSKQLTEITRRINNERNSSSRVAYGTRTQTSSRENQLSIEAF